MIIWASAIRWRFHRRLFFSKKVHRNLEEGSRTKPQTVIINCYYIQVAGSKTVHILRETRKKKLWWRVIMCGQTTVWTDEEHKWMNWEVSCSQVRPLLMECRCADSQHALLLPNFKVQWTLINWKLRGHTASFKLSKTLNYQKQCSNAKFWLAVSVALVQSMLCHILM